MALGVNIPRSPWSKPKPKPVVTSPYVTAGNQRTTTPNRNVNLYNPVASQNKPGTSAAVDWLDQNMPQWRNAQGYQQTRMNNALQDAFTGAGGYQLPGQMPMGPGGGGRGGGGGGGGGAAGGLDQATLDWLFGQLGQGRPQGLTFNPLDLPDPSQYYKPFDTSQYDIARQGVTGGLDAMRTRGNTAFDTAVGELNRYQNPYGAGLQTRNPDQTAAMERMLAANQATSPWEAIGQGAQADQAMGNVMALLAGNDQARQAANLRATEADRRMMEQNLGLEGNMLNLGVNMSQAKAKSAYDQALQDAMYQNALQESMQNWTRQNTVGDTNVAGRNQWNQGLMQTLLSIIGAKAPGTTLPTDTGAWYATA